MPVENETDPLTETVNPTPDPVEEEPAKTDEPRAKKGAISYVITPNPLNVRAFRGVPVDVATGDIVVWGQNHMSRVPMPLLIALYNKIRPEAQIEKFKSREAAERTMYPTLEVLAGKPLPGSKTMPATATKKTAVKKAAAKKTTAKKAATKSAGNGEGRASAFSGMTITKLVNENPRREGTFGFKSFALIKNGMTYEKYIEAGGRRVDLAWDVDHKYVKVAK